MSTRTTPNMLKLVKTVAAMKYDGEEIDGEPYVMENDDAVETMGDLIQMSRQLLKDARAPC